MRSSFFLLALCWLFGLPSAGAGSTPELSARPISFPNRIVPIFTKTGCNAGGCHGKSGGQNGFRLSLLGFEPAEDYEYLVKEARGRRLFPSAPEQSLLLLKATATLPHGGGKRIEPGSADYQRLVQWIAQGMPYGRPDDPTVSRIEVLPRERSMPRDSTLQLLVRAHYSDGSSEDVTASALFEPNDPEIAKVNEIGLVTTFQQPGDVAIMIRYQSQVAVFRATIPLGALVEPLPKPRNFVDEIVFRKLQAVGMPPSPPANDSTFLRRTALDIAGRLPTVPEAEHFLSSTAPDKRDRWIDSLLDSGAYADYFANKWAALLRNRRTDPIQTATSIAFHSWIRDSLFENRPYDQFVREILTATGDAELNPPVAWYRQVRTPTAQLEDAAQLFLGLRLQCAQCHHHPFEKWSQNDYYSFAAFFSQVARKAGPAPDREIVYHRRGTATAVNKKTNQALRPAGLGSAPLELRPDDDPRQALTTWLCGPENPFFAKSLVNRYWKHFFGRGLVDPEDDMRETNPPSNPELLDALAQNFTRSGYDLKALIRAICQSQIYQLSSIPNSHNQPDKTSFSRFYPRRLSAEVLLDAINTVNQSATRFDGLPGGTRAVQLPDNSFNASSYFLTVFGRPDASSACECERSQDSSLAQSLHLLNAKDLQEKLTADTGRAALLGSDSSRADPVKLRELYLSAYARPPEEKEVASALRHIHKLSQGRDGTELIKQRRQAYEDILWAITNTKEFLFNH